MKIMIASDIHGSAYYCKKMLERYKEEKADKLLILGDILYHGPRNDLPKEYSPKDVITMLNGIKEEILCVRGNCDSEVDQMVLEFPILAEYAILYVNNHMIFATHGHNYNDSKLPMLKNGDILLHGHTHIPICEDRSNYTYMNPGSISIPKGQEGASYMLMDNNIFYWKNIDGHIFNKFDINE